MGVLVGCYGGRVVGVRARRTLAVVGLLGHDGDIEVLKGVLPVVGYVASPVARGSGIR